MSPRLSDVERSVILQYVFVISSALTYLRFFGNVPLFLIHTSRYVTARDQCYQAFPRVSTASNKHWGEKAWVQA